MSETVLALDGGGTKTWVALVDRDGTVVSLQREAGINPFDGPQWRDVFARCLARVPQGLAGAGFGLAGYDEDRALSQALRDEAALRVRAPLAFENDVAAACRGAFAGQPGTLLLAGTGSMAWRNLGDGTTRRVGGFGALFGDEGSAYWIGRQALGVLSRALDGRQMMSTQDRIALLSLIGAADAEDPAGALLSWYAGLAAPRVSVAALAAGVDVLAARGHAAAIKIMDEAADHLGAHLVALHGSISGFAWSYGGSVFKSRHVLDRLSARFGAPCAPALPPLGGAVLLAARAAGWDVSAEQIGHLAQSLVTAGV